MVVELRRIADNQLHRYTGVGHARRHTLAISLGDVNAGDRIAPGTKTDRVAAVAAGNVEEMTPAINRQ